MLRHVYVSFRKLCYITCLFFLSFVCFYVTLHRIQCAWTVFPSVFRHPAPTP